MKLSAINEHSQKEKHHKHSQNNMSSFQNITANENLENDFVDLMNNLNSAKHKPEALGHASGLGAIEASPPSNFCPNESPIARLNVAQEAIYIENTSPDEREQESSGHCFDPPQDELQHRQSNDFRANFTNLLNSDTSGTGELLLGLEAGGSGENLVLDPSQILIREEPSPGDPMHAQPPDTNFTQNMEDTLNDRENFNSFENSYYDLEQINNFSKHSNGTCQMNLTNQNVMSTGLGGTMKNRQKNPAKISNYFKDNIKGNLSNISHISAQSERRNNFASKSSKKSAKSKTNKSQRSSHRLSQKNKLAGSLKNSERSKNRNIREVKDKHEIQRQQM